MDPAQAHGRSHHLILPGLSPEPLPPTSLAAAGLPESFSLHSSNLSILGITHCCSPANSLTAHFRPSESQVDPNKSRSERIE